MPLHYVIAKTYLMIDLMI